MRLYIDHVELYDKGHHLPRPEDWPISPVACCVFSLKPVGFFDTNPVLAASPTFNNNGACHT